MTLLPRCLLALTVAASPAFAQTSQHADSSATSEETAHRTPLEFGMAGGALSYEGGRQEQAIGAVLRWVTTPWLSFSATPTAVHVRQPSATVVGTVVGTTGIVDLPMDATLSHDFKAPWSPGVALALGVSLPVGDTASGFGAGKMGYSASAGFGFAPAERLWVHLGAGRSLTDVAMQSAFASGSGWGDASAGVSLTERFSVSGGYSTDLGGVDSTVGHSTSLDGGLSFVVKGPTTLNVNASHGMSGVAPRWSLAIGLGTAFPYLTHVGAGSPIDALRGTFGGGTHGLGSGATGTGPGNSGSAGGGNGRGRKAL
ncbi:MAG TPA: hypothetical protein VF461_06485 [Gemmatimonadaceae bacterium]